MSLHPFILLLSLVLPAALVMCTPYNRWGPGEGYGHTGNSMPAPNPNAAYGYDRAGILGDSSNYGAVYNRHRHRSGRLLPSFGPRFGSSSNRRSDVGADNSVDGSAIVEGGEYQRRRRQRPHEDFYASLEALYGRFRVPRIVY